MKLYLLFTSPLIAFRCVMYYFIPILYAITTVSSVSWKLDERIPIGFGLNSYINYTSKSKYLESNFDSDKAALISPRRAFTLLGTRRSERKSSLWYTAQSYGSTRKFSSDIESNSDTDIEIPIKKPKKAIARTRKRTRKASYKSTKGYTSSSKKYVKDRNRINRTRDRNKRNQKQKRKTIYSQDINKKSTTAKNIKRNKRLGAVDLYIDTVRQVLYNKTHYSPYSKTLHGNYDIRDIWRKQHFVKPFDENFMLPPSSNRLTAQEVRGIRHKNKNENKHISSLREKTKPIIVPYVKKYKADHDNTHENLNKNREAKSLNGDVYNFFHDLWNSIQVQKLKAGPARERPKDSPFVRKVKNISTAIVNTFLVKPLQFLKGPTEPPSNETTTTSTTTSTTTTSTTTTRTTTTTSRTRVRRTRTTRTTKKIVTVTVTEPPSTEMTTKEIVTITVTEPPSTDMTTKEDGADLTEPLSTNMTTKEIVTVTEEGADLTESPSTNMTTKEIVTVTEEGADLTGPPSNDGTTKEIVTVTEEGADLIESPSIDMTTKEIVTVTEEGADLIESPSTDGTTKEIVTVTEADADLELSTLKPHVDHVEGQITPDIQPDTENVPRTLFNVKNSLWQPWVHRVRDDVKIYSFMNQILRQNQKIFDVIEKKSKDKNWKTYIRYLAKTYEEKFNEFISDIGQHKIKSRMGSERVVLNAIGVSNHILTKLFNFAIDEIDNNGFLMRHSDITKMIGEKINEEKYRALEQACSNLNICRKSNGFINFVGDVFTIISVLPKDKFELATNALTAAVKKTDFTPAFGPNIHKRFSDRIATFDSLPYLFKIGSFNALKNIFTNRNSPLVVYGDSKPNAAKRTVAMLDVIRILDQNVPGNAKNVRQWSKIKTQLNSFARHRHKNIQDTMFAFVNNIKNAFGDIDEDDKNKMINSVKLLLST